MSESRASPLPPLLSPLGHVQLASSGGGFVEGWTPTDDVHEYDLYRCTNTLSIVPHRAANKHQQRENHSPYHLRRQEQPDLRHLQLLLPKKEDRERHEPPRLPFVEANSSLNALSQQRTFSAPLTNSANFFRA
jgi:hypothetical protein